MASVAGPRSGGGQVADGLSVQPVDHVGEAHLDLTCSRLAEPLEQVVDDGT
ncbi:MAG: hypothetical protein ACRDYZ_06075 [Acidimicrobiales bacterium]